MTISSLYNQADPTGVAGYGMADEGNSAYAAVFSLTEDGTLKRIYYFSPPAGLQTNHMPDTVGIFEADNETAILDATPSWVGAELSGWVYTEVPDTDLTADTTYFAVIAMQSGTNNFAQAYLYGGSTTWDPATSADSKISMPASLTGLTNGPNGATNPYANSSGFVYPNTNPGQTLNWLIDVGIQFGTPTPPSVTTTSLPDAAKLYAYSETLEVSDGSSPYTWAVTTGDLPVGLSLASDGVISGSATVTGTSDFTVTVTDSDSQTASADLSITVQELLVSETGTTDGVTTYSVTSGLNNTDSAGPQDMRVLQPTSPAAGWPHAFLWLLPVEPGQGTEYGDSIATAEAAGVHNDYNLTCIQPGFPVDPWYADNPDDASTHQETFMLDIVNWAKANLATTGIEKHYLIGFSKSGFGSQVLFLKHQDIFEKVASWDIAANYQTLDQYDGTPVFGTQGNLDDYELYDPNLSDWSTSSNIQAKNRIWLGAGNLYVGVTSDYSDRLTADGILNTYSEVIADSHNWAPTPGWVGPAVAAIMGDSPPTTAGCMLASGII
jgi:Putative Ig domain